MTPAYLRTGTESLRRRAAKAVTTLRECRVCPRQCAVDRHEPHPPQDNGAFCGGGRWAQVSSFFPHFGEEKPLSGSRGSGTLFFSSCNLACVFCQNWTISRRRGAGEVDAAQLGAILLRIQDLGCHNLNLVSPSPWVPQILEALAWAVDRGFHLPLVYNSGGYDCVETLEILDGIVDIYLPDFKFWSRESSKRFCQAANYPDVARAGLREMHRQVGVLKVDKNTGIARRGVLVRYLVMPGCLAEAESVLQFIANELSPDTYLNLMGQYRPGHLANRFPKINRRPDIREILAVRHIAAELGLSRVTPADPLFR